MRRDLVCASQDPSFDNRAFHALFYTLCVILAIVPFDPASLYTDLVAWYKSGQWSSFPGKKVKESLFMNLYGNIAYFPYSVSLMIFPLCARDHLGASYYRLTRIPVRAQQIAAYPPKE